MVLVVVVEEVVPVFVDVLVSVVLVVVVEVVVPVSVVSDDVVLELPPPAEPLEDVVPVFVVVVVAVVEELHSDSDLIFVINLISSLPYATL